MSSQFPGRIEKDSSVFSIVSLSTRWGLPIWFLFSSFSSSCLWVRKYFSYRLRLRSRRWTILIKYSSVMGIIAMELYVFSLLRSYDVSSLGMEST